MKAFFWRGIPVRSIILSARYQGKAATLPLRNYHVFFFVFLVPVSCLYVAQKYNRQTIKKKLAPHARDTVDQVEKASDAHRRQSKIVQSRGPPPLSSSPSSIQEPRRLSLIRMRFTKLLTSLER